MIRTIEKHHNCVIQKVFGPKGNLLRYQAGIIGDASTLTACSTLSEARASIGISINPPSIQTKPKSEYVQNQKGYDPHRR